MLRSRILTGLVGAVLAGVLASQMASCTLDVEGTKPKVAVEEIGGPCTDDSNCQTRLPCSPGICLPDQKLCSYTLLDGVNAPASAQISSDCQTIVCNAGDAETVPDSQDFFNDNNSCTTDSCVAGTSTNSPLAEGDKCDVGNKDGVCTGGTCKITCTSNSECEDGNPCSENFCDTSKSECVFTFLDGVLTPGATQTPSDCKVRFCVNGVDGDVNDDADVSDDMNPCTDNVCANGTPVNPPVPVDPKTMCPPVSPSVTGVCDGAGVCVECVDKDDCTNIVESECEKRSCVNNKCVIAYEGQATDASPVLQQGKDCKRVVCSGMAMPLTATITDNNDLPDDGFPCTTDTCVNGTPTFVDKSSGTMCGNGQVCNATGDCVGCNSPADCAGTDDFCKQRTCNNQTCGFNYTANNTDLPTGQTAGDCKVLECDGAGNVKTSVLQSDVPVDGNQCTNDVCNAAGTPSNPPTAINSACSVGANNACDGAGNCEKSNGLMCAAGSECVSTRCVDGVCCNNACTTVCEACNVAGSVGTCTAVPKGQDDGTCTGATESCNGSNDCDNELGGSCAAGSECLSNFCAEGICCNSSCSGVCRSCSMAKTGMPSGTCSNISVNTDPDNECTMTAASTCGDTGMCDGSGACQKHASGTVCAAQSCMAGDQSNADTCNGTGTCVDNGTTNCNEYACVGTACKTSCTTDADCSSSNYCNTGNNTCVPKKTNGNACTGTGNQCNSGNCVDGVCCNNACAADCNSCDVAGSEGTCTMVASGTSDGACMGNSTCNGMGACKLKDGQMCMMAMASACLSGFCADGVCCNSACDTACKVCNRAGSLGMCLNRNQFEDDNDPMCSGTMTCDGMGNCKLDNGQPCNNMDSSCASGNCNNGNNMCQ